MARKLYLSASLTLLFTPIANAWYCPPGAGHGYPTPNQGWRQAAVALQSSVQRLNDVVIRASGGDVPAVLGFKANSDTFVVEEQSDEVLERDALAVPYIRQNVTPAIAAAANLAFQAVNEAQSGNFNYANTLKYQACSALAKGSYFAEQAIGTTALIPVGIITPDFLANEISVYSQSRVDLGC